ncbi:endonuclease/exonuclease/phosphatase family protein [Pedobacter gandavensis]|uniref:endonuclease/exonuclease/phosphatase family protein n=1 Tax=Pedobacter gandavensis TaxID=2679963 RepID=UPI00292EE5C3|nr:endonuclease/exonuclease/phosphatase family protein [Pedobacter gandavensis]
MKNSLLWMRRNALLMLLTICFFKASGQSVRVGSWNLKDFGQSKTDENILFIANVVKRFDVIAIQEVVAGYGGPKAVIRLAEALNKTGESWEYSFSHGTSSDRYSKERYAFMWKSKKLKKVGEAWLEKKYQLEVEREPYFGKFQLGKKTFTLVSFHAKPKSKQPETEIKYLKFLPELHPKETLIFCGDFNLPQSHSVFNPLRNMGYTSAMTNQKTSLKQKVVKGESLASEYDNFFYHQNQLKVISTGIVPFYTQFEELKDARKISDHVPVYLEFSLN